MSLTRSTVLCVLNDFSLVPLVTGRHWQCPWDSAFLSCSLPSPFITCSAKNSFSLPFTFEIKVGQNEL